MVRGYADEADSADGNNVVIESANSGNCRIGGINMNYSTPKSENENKAYDYAMFLLNIRLRTEGELREKMRSKKYEAGIMDEVIRRLKELHYIDDQRFAEVYLENLKKYKSWGYFGLKKKLMEKKLPIALIESVLSEALSEEEELEIAKRFLKKELSRPVIASHGPLAGAKQSIFRSPRPDKSGLAMTEKAKAARKLAAKGFRGSVVSKLIF